MNRVSRIFKSGREPSQAVNHIVVILMLIFALGPVVILGFNSLKSTAELGLNPLGPPNTFLWENYPEAWVEGNFAITMRNSAFLVTATVVGVLFLGGMAAYSLARLKPPGGNAFMVFMLAGTTIPVWLYIVPLFILWVAGWWFAPWWARRRRQVAAVRYSSIDTLQRLRPSKAVVLRRVVEGIRLLTVALLILAMALSAVLLPLYQLIAPWIVELFSPSGEVLDTGVVTGYLRMRFWAVPALLALFVMRGWFNGVGNTAVVMVSALFVNALNILLNWCWIEGHWGFPRLEVQGAALAST